MLAQDVLPWTLFGARAAVIREVSPHLVRVTFVSADSGEDTLVDFADAGADTRVKLLLPPAVGGLDRIVPGGDWYQQWRELPDHRRPAMRTYTVRAVRPATVDRRAEVDVDLVLHGVVGPASAWATALLAGERGTGPEMDREVLLCGPNAAHGGPYGGREWLAPSPARDLLLVGDETALPAIAAILEELPADATGTALIEIPSAVDELDLRTPAEFSVRWLPRDEVPEVGQGGLMLRAALGWVPCDAAAAEAFVAQDIPADELLWEVPGPDDVVGSVAQPGIRAWVAGEAGAVREIRRHLVGACALSRREVAFMGYWRMGTSEAN
ncbi:siderophore-interacting protein [Nakamurella sp. A5-74]|uniref:Siderophore-interacting protein n=1 Tax=Nakamurella sp. A5-74 TaxID=3158264 RepID=A0AAU8DQU3_9ACTN